MITRNSHKSMALNVVADLASNPVVLQHWDCITRSSSWGGREAISSLNAVGVELTSLGADQVLVPVPTHYVRERVDGGLEDLPPERRGLIRKIDERGHTLSIIEDY